MIEIAIGIAIVGAGLLVLLVLLVHTAVRRFTRARVTLLAAVTQRVDVLRALRSARPSMRD